MDDACYAQTTTINTK